MIAFRALAGVVLAVVAAGAQAGETVRLENVSQATRCAENDNVYARFTGAGVRHFTIEARHPAYVSALRQDSTAPDFTGCDQSHDPSYSFEPLTVTLFEDSDYKLVGHRFARFWRPDTVDFRVGQTVTRGLHLVQLIRKLPARPIEILVVYPSDGYWRIKPLPPAGLADSAYGSSFLVGPIREDGRPYVALSSIAFDRPTLSFQLAFDNGMGSLRVAEASSERTRIEVDLAPSPHPIAFAALRSMFVRRDLADAADATLEPATGKPGQFSILDFPAMDVEGATFGRSVPSRHNATAPDISFEDFARR